MKNKHHIEIRDKVGSLIKKGLSIDEIAKNLSLPLGTRYIKRTVKWYRFCVKAKENQKKAIEKHPNLYSKAGKIAQQKHPWIGKKLGEKYGKIMGKRRIKKLREEGEISNYFSKIAKRLQEVNPNHSRANMRKAHDTMKKLGKFNEHQKIAALKCMEKNPNQLKNMSKKAHKLYPLALLALESRRKNYPYKFMECFFDSDQERKLCKKLVDKGLIKKPIEKENIHFRIGRFHIDFFIQGKIFLEYHPIRTFGRRIETKESYYKERRKILDKNGFKNYPLIIIDSLKDIDEKLNKVRTIFRSL